MPYIGNGWEDWVGESSDRRLLLSQCLALIGCLPRFLNGAREDFHQKWQNVNMLENLDCGCSCLAINNNKKPTVKMNVGDMCLHVIVDYKATWHTSMDMVKLLPRSSHDQSQMVVHFQF